jgi:hypothetical protein
MCLDLDFIRISGRLEPFDHHAPPFHIYSTSQLTVPFRALGAQNLLLRSKRVPLPSSRIFPQASTRSTQRNVDCGQSSRCVSFFVDRLDRDGQTGTTNLEQCRFGPKTRRRTLGYPKVNFN